MAYLNRHFQSRLGVWVAKGRKSAYKNTKLGVGSNISIQFGDFQIPTTWVFMVEFAVDVGTLGGPVSYKK